MAKLTPYLHFDGTCREAMGFYRDCLGGQLEIETVGESQMAQGLPAEMHDKAVHAMVTAGDITIMASDVSGPDQLIRSGVVSLCVNGTDLAWTRGVFDKLSDGATVTHPLKEEYFGTYGDLTDKFGIAWMFQVDKAGG